MYCLIALVRLGVTTVSARGPFVPHSPSPVVEGKYAVLEGSRDDVRDLCRVSNETSDLTSEGT